MHVVTFSFRIVYDAGIEDDRAALAMTAAFLLAPFVLSMGVLNICHCEEQSDVASFNTFGNL